MFLMTADPADHHKRSQNMKAGMAFATGLVLGGVAVALTLRMVLPWGAFERELLRAGPYGLFEARLRDGTIDLIEVYEMADDRSSSLYRLVSRIDDPSEIQKCRELILDESVPESRSWKDDTYLALLPRLVVKLKLRLCPMPTEQSIWVVESGFLIQSPGPSGGHVVVKNPVLYSFVRALSVSSGRHPLTESRPAEQILGVSGWPWVPERR